MGEKLLDDRFSPGGKATIQQVFRGKSFYRVKTAPQHWKRISLPTGQILLKCVILNCFCVSHLSKFKRFCSYIKHLMIDQSVIPEAFSFLYVLLLEHQYYLLIRPISHITPNVSGLISGSSFKMFSVAIDTCYNRQEAFPFLDLEFSLMDKGR